MAQPEITPEVTSTAELETSTPTPTYTATYTLAVDTPAQTEEFTTPTDAGFPTLAPPDFATEEATPAALMLVAPYHGIQLAGESAVLTWSAVPDARWYRLHITGKKGKEIFRRKFTDLSTLCADGFCSFDTTGLNLKSGNYKWWIVARTPEGRTSTPKWKFKLLAPTATLPTINLPVLESNAFDDSNVSTGWYDSQMQFATSPEGSNALHLTSQASYSLPHSYINDVIMEGRVAITTGGIVFSVRNSGAGGYTATLNSVGQITIYRGETVFAAGQIDLLPGTSTLFRLSAIGNRVTVSVDGKEIVSGVDPLPLPYGVLYMGSMWNGETDATLDDFNVWGTQAQEPLRGEDLIERMIPGGYTSLAPQYRTRSLEDDDRIYFERQTSSGYIDIYSIKPDGTGVARLEIKRAWRPRISPDGDKLSYLSIVTGGDRVWIKYRQTGSIERITPLGSINGDSGHDNDATWSPESDRLAFVRKTSPSVSGGDVNIYVINIHTKQYTQRSVPIINFFYRIDWRPILGEDILAYSDASKIYTVHLSSNTPPAFLTTGDYPVWSPDGQKLLVSGTKLIDFPSGDSSYIGTSLSVPVTWAPLDANGATTYVAGVEQTRDADNTLIYKIKIIDENGNIIPQVQPITEVYNSNGSSRIAWGGQPFPYTRERCISIIVPHGLKLYSNTSIGTPIRTLVPNNRVYTTGRVVNPFGEWLKIEGIFNDYALSQSTTAISAWIPKDSFRFFPTTPTPGYTPSEIDVCDDSATINDPVSGNAQDAFELPLLGITPSSTPTPTNTLSPTLEPICNVLLYPGYKVRQSPGLGGGTVGTTTGSEVGIKVISKTENAIDGYSWYQLETWSGYSYVWIANTGIASNTNLCANLTIYNNQLTPLPSPTPTRTPSPTFTSTPSPYPTFGVSPTPTATSTLVPINFTRFDFDGTHSLLRSAMFWAIFNETSEDRYFYGGDAINTAIPTLAALSMDSYARDKASFLISSTNGYCVNGVNQNPDEQPQNGWHSSVTRIEHCKDHRYMMSQVMINAFINQERNISNYNNYDPNIPSQMMGIAYSYLDVNFQGTFGQGAPRNEMWQAHNTDGCIQITNLQSADGLIVYEYDNITSVITQLVDIKKILGEIAALDDKSPTYEADREKLRAQIRVYPSLVELRYLMLQWADQLLNCKLTSNDNIAYNVRIRYGYSRIGNEINKAIYDFEHQVPDPTNGAYGILDANFEGKSVKTLVKNGVPLMDITNTDVINSYNNPDTTLDNTCSYTITEHIPLLRVCFNTSLPVIFQPVLLLERDGNFNYSGLTWISKEYQQPGNSYSSNRYVDLCQTYPYVPRCQQ